MPVVVQVNDPQYFRCVALQKNAREAVSNFEAGELQFLAAIIRTEKSRLIANEHHVKHWTLLLLDV